MTRRRLGQSLGHSADRTTGNLGLSPASSRSVQRGILILFALLPGCHGPIDLARPAKGPAPTSSTQAVLRPIELHYSIYLARYELRITVAPDGTLRQVRTDNKSYGGNDIDSKYERIEIRQGELTPEQESDLARLFAGWDLLPPGPFGGVPDAGELSIRYGDKIVSGGSEVPRHVTEVLARLTQLAWSMPIVKR